MRLPSASCSSAKYTRPSDGHFQLPYAIYDQWIVQLLLKEIAGWGRQTLAVITDNASNYSALAKKLVPDEVDGSELDADADESDYDIVDDGDQKYGVRFTVQSSPSEASITKWLCVKKVTDLLMIFNISTKVLESDNATLVDVVCELVGLMHKCDRCFLSPFMCNEIIFCCGTFFKFYLKKEIMDTTSPTPMSSVEWGTSPWCQ